MRVFLYKKRVKFKKEFIKCRQKFKKTTINSYKNTNNTKKKPKKRDKKGMKIGAFFIDKSSYQRVYFINQQKKQITVCFLKILGQALLKLI